MTALLVSVLMQAGPNAWSALASARQAQAPRTVLGNAFTYQGRLMDAGVPLEGAHDFEFALFDVPDGGSPLGQSITANDVLVTNGHFSVALDFGDQFTGEARWLDVAVDGEPVGRQELTATPYALYAKASDWNGLQNVPADFADGVDNDTKDWNALENVPPGFQDGIDDGESYVIGSGLELVGANLSVKFAGTGSADTAARSDHHHLGTSWTTSSGTGLSILNTGFNSRAIEATVQSGWAITGTAQVGNEFTGGGGVRGLIGTCSTGVQASAVFGCRPVGVGSGVAGQYGGCGGFLTPKPSGVGGCSSSAFGVFGVSLDSTGVRGESLNETGVSGISVTGIGVLGERGACTPITDSAVYGCTLSGVPAVVGSRGDCQTPFSTLAAIIGCASSGNIALIAQSGACAFFGPSDGALTACSDQLPALFGISGQNTGVQGTSFLGHGVSALSAAGGPNGAALAAESTSPAGVAIYAKNNSATGTTIIGEQNGTGDIFRGFSPGLVFQVQSDGDVRADGTFASPAGDLAEQFETDGSLEPGTVVAIDPVTGAFVLASSANSAYVVGVVSTKPGVVLGVGIEDEVAGSLIALAGRVPVFVTDENGTVLPGDLLVSSSAPGKAMKAPANPAPGTIIGKAVGFVDPAAGTVMMLVMNR